ncbi:hypothetical protein E2C01_076126 [Portunus trituberculatus]|uniref:Uncharacterized protein n=1 Tax=Portunus trituberculatus TaxID=210409 RepID=A0A5B7IH09_PORTR|nr:hypothetical protein [Portunus trituberculatus]
MNICGGRKRKKGVGVRENERVREEQASSSASDKRGSTRNLVYGGPGALSIASKRVTKVEFGAGIKPKPTRRRTCRGPYRRSPRATFTARTPVLGPAWGYRAGPNVYPKS